MDRSMVDVPAARDYERFVRLLSKHGPAVRSYLRALLPSWHAVDEVAQEASLVAWQKFGELREDAAFGGWLLTIARYEALKYRRRLARSPFVFSAEVWDLLAAEAEDSAAQDQRLLRQHRLEKCLEKLEASKRDLLMQVYASGKSIKEVAQQLGKGEQALYKMLQRLRARLLECIQRAAFEEDGL